MGRIKNNKSGLVVGIIVFGIMMLTFVFLLAAGLLSFNFALGA